MREEDELVKEVERKVEARLEKVLEEDLERATIRLFSLLSGIGRFLRNLFTGRTD